MYWPDELPTPLKPATDVADPLSSGRRTYHGNLELVASDHLEVIDVTTISDRAIVTQWLEEGEGESIGSKLYWRQTYSIERRELSVRTLPYCAELCVKV